MTCRYDSTDPRKCDRCGEFLWVTEAGLFCGECGVTMPCTMRVLPAPLPTEAATPRLSPTRTPVD
ncbi:MAG TPA: hypothetical protein VGV89_10680 [Thermoplasmata archaeon]|nr:hypothetical protein [Thermoplasmata archaeon]